MNIKNIKDLIFFNSINIDQKSFYFGTFFLGSALPLSVIFYLVSIYFVIRKNKFYFFKDKYNQLLLVCSGIMIFSNVNSSINIKGLTGNEILNIWVNLFNWIPLFLLFYCSSFYLNNELKRKTFSKFLIAGTVPILISCILEKWFNVNGIFSTLYGSIVWYLKQNNSLENSISGLFSNRNYTGIWLSSLIGFSLYELLTIKNNLFKKIFILTLNILIIYFNFYTFSRSAIIGSIMIFLIIFNKLKLLIPIFSIYTFISLILLSFPSLNFIPLKKLFFYWRENTNFLENILQFNRVEIFSVTSKLILENPILGWGASTFPKMYESSGGIQSTQHSHNMILELAYNYGIPLSILLSSMIFVLLFKAFKLLYKKNTDIYHFSINKCWFASTILVTFSHLSDITYYDGKISILIWVLLSGLRSIVEEKSPSINIKTGDIYN